MADILNGKAKNFQTFDEIGDILAQHYLMEEDHDNAQNEYCIYTDAKYALGRYVRNYEVWGFGTVTLIVSEERSSVLDPEGRLCQTDFLHFSNVDNEFYDHDGKIYSFIGFQFSDKLSELRYPRGHEQKYVFVKADEISERIRDESGCTNLIYDALFVTPVEQALVLVYATNNNPASWVEPPLPQWFAGLQFTLEYYQGESDESESESDEEDDYFEHAPAPAPAFAACAWDTNKCFASQHKIDN